MAEVHEVRMLDIRGPVLFQVSVSPDHRTLWINVDGVCMLRRRKSKFSNSLPKSPRRTSETTPLTTSDQTNETHRRTRTSDPRLL